MSRDTYYWTCPYCGSNLDPEERCDCRNPEQSDEDYKLVQKGGVVKCSNEQIIHNSCV